jgi:hypothetical protein
MQCGLSSRLSGTSIHTAIEFAYLSQSFLRRFHSTDVAQENQRRPKPHGIRHAGYTPGPCPFLTRPFLVRFKIR